MRTISYFVACFFCVGATAFIGSFSRIGDRAVGKLQMVDVEITFPGNKKVKAASGSLLKEVHPQTQHFKYSNEAAKKARFSPNYGCDEGKCGSCELKVNGKTKIRPCIGKVPAAGPVILTEP